MTRAPRAAAPADLRDVVARLRRAHGAPVAPPTRDPFELVLWENVVYLADDTRRAAAFAALVARVGTRPEALLAASDAKLLVVTRSAGILPEQSAEKLRRCARLCRDAFGGDLAAVVARPVREAVKALKRFPGLGEPGAGKVLLFAGAHALLPLESNGLRVMVRLGTAPERRGYAATWAGVAAALEPQVGAGRGARHLAFLQRAWLLLREHGRRVCRRSRPECGVCTLRPLCAFGAGSAA